MRTENIKVKLDISVPTDRPDKNGNIYTTDAVLKACTKEKLDKLPLIFRDQGSEKVIGAVLSDNLKIVRDVDNRVYHINIDGLICYGGIEGYVNRMHKNENGETVIDDFTIAGFGISL